MKKHIRTFRSKKLHPEHVKILNEAIKKNAKGGDLNVTIKYNKPDGTVSERKIKPLGVKDKSLLLAHCHERNAIRSFRVERVSMIKQAFWSGFEKRAWFWSKPKVLSQEHVDAIMPHFKKHEAARKRLISGKIDDDTFMRLSEPFVDAVRDVEGKSGIDNSDIYTHMYKNYSKP